MLKIDQSSIEISTVWVPYFNPHIIFIWLLKAAIEFSIIMQVEISHTLF